ncbi:hypothetical protein ACROYT_G015509 [Oculina patagonica]
MLSIVNGCTSTNKMALTLLERLFPVEVLKASIVSGSKQSKTVQALDSNKLLAIRLHLSLEHPMEHLVDTAREKNDAQASRYNSILKQTRPLHVSSHASFQPVLVKLLGDKEEIAIAREIEKAFKHSSSTSVRPLMGNPRMPYSNPIGLPLHITRVVSMATLQEIVV